MFPFNNTIFVFQFWRMDKSGTKENDSVDQSKDTTIVEVQSPVAQSSHNTIAKDVSPDESSGISLFQVSTAKADKP